MKDDMGFFIHVYAYGLSISCVHKGESFTEESAQFKRWLGRTEKVPVSVHELCKQKVCLFVSLLNV